jgi:aspartate racemase
VKTIGLIGGMSWESSLEYYRLINQGVRQRLGGQHSAKNLMISVDFAEIEHMQAEGRWDDAAAVLANCAQRLEQGGADFIVLCTNTMHKVAPAIQLATRLPLLHIADATASRIKAAGITKIGLLGTRFTMEQDFYKGRLIDQYGLTVLIPDMPDREIIHRAIYDELCLGKIVEQSRVEYLRIMDELAEQGAEAIILGCTEIGLLVKATDTTLRLFDTTLIHAEEAVNWALAND